VNSCCWNRELKKLKSWTGAVEIVNFWIHEVKIVNSWSESWNHELVQLRSWNPEVKIVNSWYPYVKNVNSRSWISWFHEHIIGNSCSWNVPTGLSSILYTQTPDQTPSQSHNVRFCVIESVPHRGQPELAKYELSRTIFGSPSAKYQSIPYGHTYTRGHPVRPPNHPTMCGSA
jgi:hypothetical protein